MQSCTIPLINMTKLNYKGNKIFRDRPIQKWPVNWGTGFENHCAKGGVNVLLDTAHRSCYW